MRGISSISWLVVACRFMLRASIRDEVLTHIHQYTHNQVSTKARNIVLVEPQWLDQLILWVTGKSEVNPGHIDNSVLKDKIVSGSAMELGKDYDFVEGNVYDTLVLAFGGGPMIMRPIMMGPDGNFWVILNPMKLEINYCGKMSHKTVDPAWKLSFVKESFCKKAEVDPVKHSFSAGDIQELDESLSCSECAKQYGTVLNMNGDQEAPVKTQSKIRKELLTAVSAYFLSVSGLLRYTLTPDEINSVIAERDTFAKGSLNYNFLSFILGEEEPDQLISVISRIFPSFAHILIENVHQLVFIMFRDLYKTIPTAFLPIHHRITIMDKCPKCGNSITHEECHFGYSIHVVKRVFGHPKFVDSLKQYFKPFQIPAGERWHCHTCNVDVRAERHKMQLEAQRILVFLIDRFTAIDGCMTRNEEKLEFPEVLDLGKFTSVPAGSMYSVLAEIENVGGVGSGKFRTLILDPATKRWSHDGETNCKPCKREIVCLVYRKIV